MPYFDIILTIGGMAADFRWELVVPDTGVKADIEIV
jgi:hypothetical protein